MTLESVKRNEDYGTTNKKVLALINNCVKELESEVLKQKAKLSLTNFASRIYMKWLNLYGSSGLGLAVLTILKQKGVDVPQAVKERYKPISTPSKTIPDKIYNRATPNMSFDLEYEKEVVNRTNEILGEQAMEDYASRYSLRASAEIQLRHEWHVKQTQALLKKGVRLVYVPPHANCSKRCAPWQDKVYSLDGTSGTTDDGRSYQPIENATEQFYTTKAGVTYKNGLFGFNCRHPKIPYQKGLRTPPIPKQVIDRQRALETRQREIERYCRIYDTRRLGWKQTAKTTKSAKEKAIAKRQYMRNLNLLEKWENEYTRFCNKNNLTRYPSRLKV